RRFPDGAPGGTTVVFKLAHGTDVDGENLASGSRHEPPSFQVRLTTKLTGRAGRLDEIPRETVLPAPSGAAVGSAASIGLVPSARPSRPRWPRRSTCVLSGNPQQAAGVLVARFQIQGHTPVRR